MSKLVQEKVSKAAQRNISNKKQKPSCKYKCPLVSWDIFLMATRKKAKNA